MSRFKDVISRGIVVSCQLDISEPLHTPQHCALFAQAAEMGGAMAVRAEGLANIQEIRATVRLPVIGCTRGQYDDGWLLVTPDLNAVDQLVRLGADVVALDGTLRQRAGNGPDGPGFIAQVKKRHPKIMLWADISSFEEGVRAADAGVEALSTALYGRTRSTEQHTEGTPQLDLIYRLATTVSVPVFAEGFVWSTADASAALEAGAYGVVVGGAVTRPRVITQLYVNAVESQLLGE